MQQWQYSEIELYNDSIAVKKGWFSTDTLWVWRIKDAVNPDEYFNTLIEFLNYMGADGWELVHLRWKKDAQNGTEFPYMIFKTLA
ncbi:MAG: hypothetical protein ABI406_19250 [Ktedonobacteraceae bacterium]